MNPNIPRLLRACYASNMIAELERFQKEHPQHKYDERVITRESYLEELNFPLFEENGDKRRALNGPYVSRIFDDISERTGVLITEPNLRKRIMGIYGNIETFAPDKKYRDALARYVGCKSWDEMDKDVVAKCEALEDSVRHVYSKDFRLVHCHEMIKIEDLYDGDRIDFRLNEGAELSLAYMGENKFVVKDVKGLIPKKNDILLITAPFILGSRIYAPEVYRAKENIGEWLCRHSIISFQITGGQARRMANIERTRLALQQVEENRKRREQHEEECRQKQLDKIKKRNQERTTKNAQPCTPTDLPDKEKSRTFAALN